MSLLEFKNVFKKYEDNSDSRWVIQDLTLNLSEESFVALTGPSGSGKTTLLNLAAGLDEPTNGVVSVLGKDLKTLSPLQRSHFRRDHMGFVFQAYNLIPVLTVCENVEFTCLLQGQSQSIARKKALEMIELVGLKEKAHKRPNELSGGQQQRVAVARSLATHPQVVFADEPTANLDTETALSLIHLFKELNKKHHVSFVFSTHDYRLSSEVDVCISLRDGQLVEVKKKEK